MVVFCEEVVVCEEGWGLEEVWERILLRRLGMVGCGMSVFV